jgi:hypothetical protein
MKISEVTITILKNLALFNNHIVVEAGNVLRTVNDKKTTIIKATVEEDFPVNFAFHDLSGFLKTITLFEDPDYNFGEDSVVISDSTGASQEYQYSDTENLIFDTRTITFPESDYEVEVSADLLKKVIKGAGINGVEDIAIVGEDGGVFLKALDKEQTKPEVNLTKSKRTFSVRLSDEDKGEFTVFLKHTKKGNKLTLLPLDFLLKISSKGIVNFVADVEGVEVSYILAIEADSQV